MPPRHGKSELCSQYFPAWYLGRHPQHRVILASYGAGFAAWWGERARDVLVEHGPDLFNVHMLGRRAARGNWRLIEGRGKGGMLATGVAGGFTGRGADCLIIDDPVKDAVEALSSTIRQRVWDWWESTARTRLEPGGIVLVIMTRWHAEDLAGRLLAQAREDPNADQWEELSLPAIAGEHDALGRAPGVALWPWRYDVEALGKIKSSTSALWWNALYQQHPTPPGGTLAKAIWFTPITALPFNVPTRYCRFWDCASSEATKGKKPDWTVGALVAKLGPLFYVLDIIRVQMSPGDVDTLIRQTAEIDRATWGPGVMIREEEEGGSSGKTVIAARKLALAGHDYKGVRASTAKEVNWQPLLVQAEVGNVRMWAAPWNHEFLGEVSEAPYGTFDDQLDATAGAFNAVALEKPKLSEATW